MVGGWVGEGRKGKDGMVGELLSVSVGECGGDEWMTWGVYE